MGKVVRLFSQKEKDQQGLIEFIEGLLSMAKSGELTSLIAAGEHTTIGTVTGYFNADTGDQLALIGHLQGDVLLQVIENNRPEGE